MSESLESMYTQLETKVVDLEDDIRKTANGNKSAGVRVRTGMQELKKIADKIRKKVMEMRKGQD